MEWVLVLLGIIGTWALLTVLGSERERRMQELTSKVLNAQRNSKSQH